LLMLFMTFSFLVARSRFLELVRFKHLPASRGDQSCLPQPLPPTCGSLLDRRACRQDFPDQQPDVILADPLQPVVWLSGNDGVCDLLGDGLHVEPPLYRGRSALPATTMGMSVRFARVSNRPEELRRPAEKCRYPALSTIR